MGNECPYCKHPGRIATDRLLGLYKCQNKDCSSYREEYWAEFARCAQPSCNSDADSGADGYCNFHYARHGGQQPNAWEDYVKERDAAVPDEKPHQPSTEHRWRASFPGVLDHIDYDARQSPKTRTDTTVGRGQRRQAKEESRHKTEEQTTKQKPEPVSADHCAWPECDETNHNGAYCRFHEPFKDMEIKPPSLKGNSQDDEHDYPAEDQGDF